MHDVGKIVMASSFPDHFYAIQNRACVETQPLMNLEKEMLGMTHAELGAVYLRNHRLPKALVEAAEFHHKPELAAGNPIVAAVQVADLLVRHAGLGQSGNPEKIANGSWLQSTGWALLFPNSCESEKAIAEAALKRSLERLPTVLEGLI